VCTYHGVTDGDLARGGEIPIGRACPYAELELVASLVDAEIQSVCVRGGSTMAGYWDARRRIAVSPVNETGFYATGDLVRRNDLGELLYAGRSDRQIKIHGYRIQLEEVEHAARRVPLVADAAAAKVQGANGPMIGLCVEGLADDAASLDVLRKNLRRRLPFYVEPEIIRILNALPRCSRGKVDYRAVASTLQNVAMQDSG
jgi:acyl-CoA synthetase (AMP-forming)/AMP-acid ligase II